MEPVPCLGCSEFFTPRNRSQSYCTNPKCQKKRKALWQKQKVQNNPEYRENQKLSNNKWLSNNPDYWKKYRLDNPDKTQRNRLLQKVRNKHPGGTANFPEITAIAKMDASKPFNIKMDCEFWLIPVIAKMDVAKFKFRLIPDN
jgi:hypothetical protein